MCNVAMNKKRNIRRILCTMFVVAILFLVMWISSIRFHSMRSNRTENGFDFFPELILQESAGNTLPSPIHGASGLTEFHDALPLSELLGPEEEMYVQDMLCGLTIDLETPIPFEKGNGTTTLRFPRKPDNLAWDGTPPIRELVFTLDDETGTFFTVTNKLSDVEIQDICSKWFLKGDARSVLRLVGRRDVSTICMAVFRQNGIDPENTARYFWIDQTTGQILDSGLFFQ